MEYKFKKVHTGKDLAISGIIIAAGIGLYFLNAGLGCVILFCWVMMLPFWHPGYRITGREGVFTLEEILVARECRGRRSLLQQKRKKSGVQPDFPFCGA